MFEDIIGLHVAHGENGDLYKGEVNSVLLKFVGKAKSLKVMGEVHEGLYGSHIIGPTMK